MATKKGTQAPEGFLTTAAQAIGSTLGQLAKKAGVVAAPTRPVPKKASAKKAAAKKTAAKKTPAKKKAAAKKTN